MTVVWERRVRTALVQQRAVPLTMRLEGVRLIATGAAGRFLRRSWFRITAATVVVLVLMPAILVSDLLLKTL